MIPEKQVEEIARKYCQLRGWDPDLKVLINTTRQQMVARWTLYTDQARY